MVQSLECKAIKDNTTHHYRNKHEGFDDNNNTFSKNKKKSIKIEKK